MTTIILMRHGESEANLAHIFAGRNTDLPLSPRGRAQAERAAAYIQRGYAIDRLLTGPLSRASETCAAVAARLGMPYTADIGLTEIDGGDWEGKTVDALTAEYGDEYLVWRHSVGLSRPTNGESFCALGERAARRVSEIAQENAGQTVLCVSHAAFIRAAYCHFGGIAPEKAQELPWPGNASLTVLTFGEGRPQLTLYGYDAYLGDKTAEELPVRPYPMQLSFLPHARIWGGDRLVREYGKNTAVKPLGETWELTVREDGESRVLNGACAGDLLATAIKRTGGSADARFPLLIKFIDAADRLSVQVHPDDAYGVADGDMGKTEMWYILDAAPGARIVYGLAEGIGQTEFAAAVREGRTEEVLCYRPVKRGDVFFIPSGLVHAIGEGILIAEIQQNSDLTYRVYDYDRRDASGRLRELHVDKALDVVRSYTEEEISAIRFSRLGGASADPDLLADCPYFRVRRKHLHDGTPLVLPASDRFLSLLCSEGGGKMAVDGREYIFQKGDSWFLPAGMSPVCLCGEAELLLSSV